MNGSWISVQSAVHDLSASIFFFPELSASVEPAGFDGKLWSVALELGGFGEERGVRAMMKVS